MQRDDNIDKTSQLSSICNELRSTSQQRDQELHNISQLLEGIKQLQAAQQNEDAYIPEGHEQWMLAAAVAATQQQPDSSCKTEVAPTQQKQSGISANHLAANTSAANVSNQSTDAVHTRRGCMQGNSWPQSTLLQLLDGANSSGSTKGNAICPGSPCSSSPESSPTSRQPQAASCELKSAERQQAGAAHAISRFSFPETATAQGLKYITPIKIPHHVRPTRCSVVNSDNGDSSSPDSKSSGRGSYVGGFYHNDQKPCSSSQISAVAGVSKGCNKPTSDAAGFVHQLSASPAAQHAARMSWTNNSWQPSASPSPRLTPTSSMSSEAAALMLALRAAAEQREATRAVLQAKSSIASPTTRAHSPVDWDNMSDAPVGVDLGVHSAKQPAAAIKAQVGAAMSGSQLLPVVEPRPCDRLCNEEGDNGAEGVEGWPTHAQSLSPQPSVKGPFNQSSSSCGSIHRSQRAAADQLMHEAVETSSMSSWLALLDNQATDDADDVDDDAAHEAAPSAEAAVPAANTADVAQTWGSSCGTAPATDCSSSGGSPRGQDGAVDLCQQASRSTEVPKTGYQGCAADRAVQQPVQLQHEQYNQLGSAMQRHQVQQGQQQVDAGSQLPSAAAGMHHGHLLDELGLLEQQVNAERQQLAQLQKQRQLLQQDTDGAACTAAAATHTPIHPQVQTQQIIMKHKQAVTGNSSAATVKLLAMADAETQTDQSAPLVSSSTASVPADAAIEVHEAASQTDGEVAERQSCTDAACQAMLLHVSGLQVVGPPPACRVCPLVQQQLQEQREKLQHAQEQQKQAQLSAERSHHQAMTAEAQLTLSRQKLRAVISANAKPLAMSGWEDLIEEAAADLERIEQHVATAAERLIELQAASASAAEALVTSQREADRQQTAAATAALRTEALQQQAEGLIAAITSNQHTRDTASNQLASLQQQLTEQQAAVSVAEQELKGLQQQLQQAKQQLAEADQQLADKQRGRQQIVSDVSEKQHQLQVTRGECASAQDRLTQLQLSLVEARQQAEDLQQQQRQQQRQHEDADKQLAALQAQRTAAAAEAASAEQELSRVLRELDQCQKDIQVAELQQAELDEATAEKQRQLAEIDKAAAAADKKRGQLESEVQQLQEQLKHLQQQAQAAKHEADLCTRAAATADRQLLQVQQTLTALQSGTANHINSQHSPAPTNAANTAAAAAAVTAHMAECAQLQVKLAAAESRRQLAEERQEEAERRLQQVRNELNGMRDERDAAERQLRQATAKCDKLKEKLREKCESLVEVQGQLQQAQKQLQDQCLASAAAKARERQLKTEGQTAADAAGDADAQQLLQSYQQRLKELESDVASARSQLQQAQQQLEQQRQSSNTLQQQLSSTQQQLVQAQQQLLEAPRQAVSGMLNHHQQADRVQMAVRSSIQGLQEAWGLQAKLQHAQLEADTVKRQLQDAQAEKKQLQKKLVAYKQHLAEIKCLYDPHKRRLARNGAESPLPEPQIYLLKQQEEKLANELATAQQQLTQTQQQLQCANCESEHNKQLLQQQQEICSQLRAELQRLEQQSASQRAACSDKVLVHAFTQADDKQDMVTVVCNAEQIQQIQAELDEAKQQLLHARAECSAANQELHVLQQQLTSAKQQQQQQYAQLQESQQQLRQKGTEMSQKAQQLVQQQQEHKWQQVQWEQKLQSAVQQAGQELLECRSELADRQAALKQLQGAAFALEQQLAAAVKAAQQYGDSQDAADRAASSEFGASQLSYGAVNSSTSSPNEVHKLASAVQLVKQLAASCSAAQEANKKLQQQLQRQQVDAEMQLRRQQESSSSQLQQMMQAIEVREIQRQEAELLQLKLQQECQLLRLQLQQQQQQQQEQQSHLPGHMRSMSSVLALMQQLHAATERSMHASTAAGWGSSSRQASHSSAIHAAGTAAAAAVIPPASTAFTTPTSTPHMSLETLAGLLPPANCLSPKVPAAASAGGGPAAQNSLQGLNPALPASSNYLQTSAAAAAAAGGDATVAHGDVGLQKSWEWVQQRAASHDRLLQHIRQTWEQAAHLAQQCLTLQAPAAAECKRSQDSAAQTDQAVHQQQQQQCQPSSSSTPQSTSSQPASSTSNCLQAEVTLNAQQCNTQPSQPTVGAAGALAVAQPLLLVVQQLQQDIATLVQLNKHLVDKAKKLCSSFRSGGRAVRVRALSLKLELQQCCLLQPRDGQQQSSSGQHSAGDMQEGMTATAATAAARVSGEEAVLPAFVAQSVVQHWDEVELLLAQLHKSCEALLLPPSTLDNAKQQQQQQQHQQQQEVGCSGRSSSSCSTSPAKHAERRCRKVLDGLQELIRLCSSVHQQQSQSMDSPGIAAAGGNAVKALPQQQQQQQQASEETGGDWSGSSNSRARQRVKQRKETRQSPNRPYPQQLQTVLQPVSGQHSSSISSCSSDAGLGELLAMVTRKLSPYTHEAAATDRNSAAARRVEEVEKPSGRSRSSTLQLELDSQGVKASQLVRDVLQQQTQHNATVDACVGTGTLADTAKGGRMSVDLLIAGSTIDKGGGTATAVVATSLGHVDVASSASIRRAERALLLERLKALQQQQKQLQQQQQ